MIVLFAWHRGGVKAVVRARSQGSRRAGLDELFLGEHRLDEVRSSGLCSRGWTPLGGGGDQHSIA